MVRNSKVTKAYKAMRNMGIPQENVKPVLKDLLHLYDKNWELIEEDNYSILIDAIFDRQKTIRQESLPEDETEEFEQPLERHQLRCQNNQPLVLPGNSRQSYDRCPSRMQGQVHVPEACCQQKLHNSANISIGDKNSIPETASSAQNCIGKKRHSSSPCCSVPGQTGPSHQCYNERTVEYDRSSKRLNYEGSTCSFSFKELEGVPGGDFSRDENFHDKHDNQAISITSESDDEFMPRFEVPLAIVAPALPSLPNEDGGSSYNVKENDLVLERVKNPNAEVVAHCTFLREDGSSTGNCSNFKGNGLELVEFERLDAMDKNDSSSNSLQFDVASSSRGDVKISLLYNSSGLSDFQIPKLDVVLKLVEEKYCEAYKNEPDFSLRKLMKDICECFLAEGTNCVRDARVSSENLTMSAVSNGCISSANVTPFLAVSNKFNTQDILHGTSDCQGDFCSWSKFPNGPFRFRNLIEVHPQIPKVLASNNWDNLHHIIGIDVNGNHCNGIGKKIESQGGSGSLNSGTLVVVQKQSFDLDPFKAARYVDDITRGSENVKISLVNEISDECLPDFNYIPSSISYQNAYVKFLLARMSDQNSCSSCSGDCMSLAIPCACAGETGGEFTYTPSGFVKEKFLMKCISVNRNQQHNLFYCNDCPLERYKGKRSAKCKGHLVRKFIKECWYKCGCSKQCGNRVVQRGITANLQVFMTPEGKGWGVRTLEDLPKGAFICEYVGEIVTNLELFERNTRTSGKEKHTYPVLLDADWGSESVLKDEEALCLDATIYGNVARFINHRCFDANLVEIPVEVETPDRHYYHLAFFTTREVVALEELTWDYGIDFEDHSHPVKAFRCHCRSNFCRDIKKCGMLLQQRRQIQNRLLVIYWN